MVIIMPVKRKWKKLVYTGASFSAFVLLAFGITYKMVSTRIQKLSEGEVKIVHRRSAAMPPLYDIQRVLWSSPGQEERLLAPVGGTESGVLFTAEPSAFPSTSSAGASSTDEATTALPPPNTTTVATVAGSTVKQNNSTSGKSLSHVYMYTRN